MCMIDYADSRAGAGTRKTRRARKPHHRCECGRVISAGETYLYQSFVQEGSASSFHTCSHCQVGYDWLMENCGGHLTGGDSLREEMEEHASEYRQIAFGLLWIKAGMRRRWQRWDGAGLMRLPSMPRAVAETMREVG